MKISFVYNRCSLGGLESATKNKMDYLKDLGVDSQAIFLRPGFEKQTFKEHKCFVAANDEKVAALTSDSDVIVDLSPDESIISMLYKLNKPVIHECHCGVRLSYLKNLNQNLVKAIIFPTKFKMNMGKPFVNEGMLTFALPNCLGKNFLISSSSLDNGESAKKTILWVGRIDPFKNWMLLMDLTKKIDRSYIIQMVSDVSISRDYQKFQEAMKDGDIADRIELIKDQPYESIGRFYQDASTSGCYLSGSMSESFGMTVLEAMGSNCPMVLSDIPAFNELAKDCALYFQPKDAEACLASIYKICEDTRFRQEMLERQKKNYVENFDPITICRKYLDIINQVI